MNKTTYLDAISLAALGLFVFAISVFATLFLA